MTLRPVQQVREPANRCVATTAYSVRELEDTPARFLDTSEGLRMGLGNEQLIHESIECNHAAIGPKTLKKYREEKFRGRPGRRGPSRASTGVGAPSPKGASSGVPWG